MTARVATAICQGAAGFVLVILAGVYADWSGHYFFLFDDFALIGEASTQTARAIFSTPLFGFYRPLVFLITKAEFSAFGWQHPEAALRFSQLFHLVNAGLVFLLARKLQLRITSSAVAATIFALSPWSSEVYGWVSGRFDLFSTTGVLATMLMGLWATDAAERGSRGVAVAAIVAGMAATFVAVFSKESGAMVPVYCTVLLLTRRRSWIQVGFLAGVVAVVALYLVWRQEILPSFNGAYGTFASMIDSADIVGNFGKYVMALVTVPRPGFIPTSSAGPVMVAILMVLAGTVCWQVYRTRPALLWLCLTAFVVGLAPVIWLPVLSGSTAGGRFLYLPALWICVLAGAATERGLRGDRPHALSSIGVAVMVPVVVIAALISVAHQATTWMMATSLSRHGIRAFEPLVDQGLKSVYLPELPYWFAEGPFVLKPYAFRYYFAGRSVPPVRSRDLVVTRRDTRAVFAGWKDTSPETAIEPAVQVHDLQLPISFLPSRLSLDRTRVSLFHTANTRSDQAVRIALDASVTARWSLDVPADAPFDVSPRQGIGPATLEVTPNVGAVDVDRTFRVPIRVDGREAARAEIGVHVKNIAVTDTVPPFGWVDVPVGDIDLKTPVMLQGWTLDDFHLRRVWVVRVDAAGAHVPIGDVNRQGERPDVTRLHSGAHDTALAAWSFVLDAALVSAASRPFVIRVLAEDGAGNVATIGQRTVR